MRFLTKKTAVILGLLGTVSVGLTAALTTLLAIAEGFNTAFRNCRLEDEQYCTGYDLWWGWPVSYSCEPCDYPYGSYRNAILCGTLGGAFSLSCCIASVSILVKILQSRGLQNDEVEANLESVNALVSEAESSTSDTSSLGVVTVYSDPGAEELSSVGLFKKSVPNSGDVNVGELTEDNTYGNEAIMK